MQFDWVIKKQYSYRTSKVRFLGQPFTFEGLMENSGHSLPLLFKQHEAWSVDSRGKSLKLFYQLSYSKARMHQIRFWLGSAQTPLGELTAFLQTS